MKTLTEYIDENLFLLEWLDDSGKNEGKIADKYIAKLKDWCDKNAANKTTEWNELREKNKEWLCNVINNDKEMIKLVAEIFPIYKKYPNCQYVWPLYSAITYTVYTYGSLINSKGDANKFWNEYVSKDIDDGANIKHIYIKSLQDRKKFNQDKELKRQEWVKQNKDNILNASKKAIEEAKKYIKAEAA